MKPLTYVTDELGVAARLVARQIPIIEVAISRTKPGWVEFHFEKTPQLALALADLAGNPQPETLEEARVRRSLRERAKIVKAAAGGDQS